MERACLGEDGGRAVVGPSELGAGDWSVVIVGGADPAVKLVAMELDDDGRSGGGGGEGDEK